MDQMQQVEKAIIEQLLNRSRRAAEKPVENGQPGTLLRAEFAGLTPLDFLAAQAPKEIPRWFRDESEKPMAVPVPVTLARADAEAERHNREFGRHDNTKDFEERRAASVAVVNGLVKLAEKDSAEYQRTVAKASTFAELRLAARWRYWWARESLAVRDEFAAPAGKAFPR